MHGEALGDRDLYGRGGRGACAHIGYNGVIVKGRAQLIFAGADLGIGMGKLAVGLKEPFILDESRVLQRI